MGDEILSATFDDGGALIVVGEVDSYSTPELSARCADDAWNGVIDLSGVTFMDSSGIRLLVEANRAERRSLVLRAPSEAVVRLLELSGVAPSFAIET